jgi:hypothetical protein
MRRPHHGDEIQSITVPPGENVVAPVELRVLRLLAAPLFQLGNHESGLGVYQIT